MKQRYGRGFRVCLLYCTKNPVRKQQIETRTKFSIWMQTQNLNFLHFLTLFRFFSAPVFLFFPLYLGACCVVELLLPFVSHCASLVLAEECLHIFWSRNDQNAPGFVLNSLAGPNFFWPSAVLQVNEIMDWAWSETKKDPVKDTEGWFRNKLNPLWAF